MGDPIGNEKGLGFESGSATTATTRRLERHDFDPISPDRDLCKWEGCAARQEDPIHQTHQPFQYDPAEEDKRNFSSGVTSTKQPRLALIPHAGLVNAAVRFELGIEKHGTKAWNNLSPNQEALKDEEWLIERASHVIEHAYRLIEFLTHKTSNVEAAKGDAGAIAWGGLVLGEALCRTKEETIKHG